MLCRFPIDTRLCDRYYDADTDTYTFSSTALSAATSTVTLAATDVVPVFRESNTVVEFDEIVIRSLISTVPVTIGTAEEAEINQVRTCTRFQINGRDITLRYLRFDQSKCVYTETMRQTPIVFSGQYAQRSEVSEITVVDSSAAVAVLGGDSLVYR